MKERIVITQDWLVKDMKAGVVETDKLFICQKVEQVPETWEDLKELCEKTDYVKTANIKNIPVYLNEFGTGYIIIKGLYFGINGKIFYEVIGQRYIIAQNRTPAQMWQIIKGLTEE